MAESCIRLAKKEDCTEIMRLIQVNSINSVIVVNCVNCYRIVFCIQELADYEKMSDGPKITAEGNNVADPSTLFHLKLKLL